MTNDELQSQTISYLRFPLTLGIIFIHFDLIEHAFIYQGVHYGLNPPAWFVLLVNFFSEVFPQIGVPLFFIISGYLFFFRGQFDHDAYILFSGAAQTLIITSPLRLFHDANGTGFPYPINLPMWYVRDLMVMVVLSPVFFWLLIRMGKWLVMLLGVFFYLYQPLFAPDGNWCVLLSHASFFFCWGAYYGIRKENFVDRFRGYPYLPLLYLPIAVADALTRGTSYNLMIHQTGVFLGTISAFIIVAYLLERGRVHVNPTLAGSSFFVYALHTSVLFEVSKIVFIVFCLGDNVWSMLILYFATPLFTAALCVALYLFLKRFFPAFCNILTGGR